jgi:hypothetical protein
VPIMAAGNEGPLPAETVAAIHRDRLTTRKERSRHDGSGMTSQDLRRALIRQPRQETAGANGHLHIPPRGTVLVRDVFHDPEHGEGVDL